MRVAVRPPLPVVLAALAALASSGCGGDPEQTPAAGAASSAPSASANANPAQGSATPAASPAADPADTSAGARRASAPLQQPAAADLANFSCTRRGGAWSASGDITNSAKEAMVYTVTVVTVAGATVAGADTEQFLLEPGESTGFDLRRISRGAAETCMPQVVRTPR